MDSTETHIPGSWLQGAGSVLGLLLPILAAGLGTINYIQSHAIERELDSLSSRVGSNQSILSQLVGPVASLVEYRESHKQEKDFWIGRINTAIDTVTDLKTKASSRPDPYTGTDARRDLEKVQNQITANHSEILSIKIQLSDLRRLSKDCDRVQEQVRDMERNAYKNKR